MTIDVITAPIAGAIVALPDILKDYQTLIGAILGFPGIMYTLYKNNKNQLQLQADQKEHDLQMQAEHIRHETNTLRLALKSELTSNIKIYRGRVEELGQPTGNLVFIPTKTFDATYLSLRDRLGSLTEEEVDNVLRAYQLIDEFSYRLRNAIRIEECGVIHDEYLLFDVGKADDIIDLHRVFIGEFEKAVKSLNKNLGVEGQAIRTDEPQPETNRQQSLPGDLSDQPAEHSSP